MKPRIILCCVIYVIYCFAAAAAAHAQTSSDKTVPHLSNSGTAKQLFVDGKPFLVLGGELHNSSSSSLEYMKPVWPKLASINLNTVLAVVSWELTEPEEGKFDFTLVDGLINEARANNLRLIILWFGSWKNGMSTYIPAWVKTNPERFPRARDQNGKALEILSTFSDANRDADARAFAAFMRHLKEVDDQKHTVIMIQVENEVGILGDSRDRCEAANKVFAGPAPKELLDYLQKNKDGLIPEFRKVWEEKGLKTSGTWEEIFGSGKPKEIEIPVRTLSPPMTQEEHETAWRKLYWPADEIFMAWHYARYVNKVAGAGKAEYNIPMFVNAWLQQRDHAWPGTYPSGGPLPQVIDVWHAGAPAIDILAPDLYVPEFAELCARYTRAGNPLFMPETRGGAQGAANAIRAFGRYKAIGFSPFGIDGFGGPFRAESTAAPENDPLAQCYKTISQLMPVILQHQADGTMTGVAQDVAADGAMSESRQQVQLGDYALSIDFGDSRRRQQQQQSATGRPAQEASPGCGIIIMLAPDEYLIAGKAMTISFAPAVPGAEIAGLAMVEEGQYIDGRWVPGRRLNGDEIQSGKGLRFPGDRFGIQRVKLYRYR